MRHSPEGSSCISIQIPPNRYLLLEVPEGPAAATSIQGDLALRLVGLGFARGTGAEDDVVHGGSPGWRKTKGGWWGWATRPSKASSPARRAVGSKRQARERLVGRDAVLRPAAQLVVLGQHLIEAVDETLRGARFSRFLEQAGR